MNRGNNSALGEPYLVTILEGSFAHRGSHDQAKMRDRAYTSAQLRMISAPGAELHRRRMVMVSFFK